MPSEEVRAEAAAWIAQLHDEQRSPDLEARVHAWLRESDAHREAFNRMTRAWELTGRIRMRSASAPVASAWSSSRLLLQIAVLAVLLLLVLFGIFLSWPAQQLITQVGEQRTVLLDDGTRVVLNTDTRVRVRYQAHERRVLLEHGEAAFDVARHPERPFVVVVAGREIRALGTSFMVRSVAARDFAVTLVEGQISVSPEGVSDDDARAAADVLAPGQRLTVVGGRLEAVDQPKLSQVTAWERGRVEFDDAPLAEAAREMNRYSLQKITISDPDVARLRIGGVFRAGDSEEFVRFAIATFELHSDRHGHEIALSRREPSPAGPALQN